MSATRTAILACTLATVFTLWPAGDASAHGERRAHVEFIAGVHLQHVLPRWLYHDHDFRRWYRLNHHRFGYRQSWRDLYRYYRRDERRHRHLHRGHGRGHGHGRGKGHRRGRH